MKNTKIVKLFKSRVLPQLGNTWTLRKNTLLKEPTNEILRGIIIESSAFSANQFAMNVFVQPLFVPIPILILSYGYRQRTSSKREWWEFDENSEEILGNQLIEAIGVSEGSFLSKINDARSFYEYYKKDKKATVGNFQSVAYAACYAGLSESKSELSQLLQYIRKNEDLNQTGTKDLYARAEALLNIITDGGSPRELLDKWLLETKVALKL